MTLELSNNRNEIRPTRLESLRKVLSIIQRHTVSYFDALYPLFRKETRTLEQEVKLEGSHTYLEQPDD